MSLSRIMRKVTKKILHCADTGVDQDFDIEDIRRWHTQGNGWSDIGYHYYIKLDGTVQIGRPVDKTGAHCRGENEDSIGICFEGGKKEDGSKWDKATDAQEEAFFVLNYELDQDYGVTPCFGHYDFSNKSCPSFSVPELMSRYFNRIGKGSR